MSWVITGSEKYETDPYRSQVSLLLHGDGTNGSTTIVDSSPSPKAVTAFGDAQISTAQSKFGGASISFDGNGDYLTTPSASFNVGADDFTIEAQLYRSASGAPYQCVVGLSYAETGGLFFGLENGNLVLFGINGGAKIIQGGGISLSTWTHIAVSKASGVYRLWIDGVQSGSSVTNTIAISAANPISFGASYNGIYPLMGYLDEVRLTYNVARYTSNFTPPTAPFPDS